MLKLTMVMLIASAMTFGCGKDSKKNSGASPNTQTGGVGGTDPVTSPAKTDGGITSGGLPKLCQIENGDLSGHKYTGGGLQIEFFDTKKASYFPLGNDVKYVVDYTAGSDCFVTLTDSTAPGLKDGRKFVMMWDLSKMTDWADQNVVLIAGGGPTPTPATTSDLIQAEITASIEIFNRVHVPDVSENADCSSSKAVIESPVVGKDSSVWRIVYGNGSEAALTQDEVASMASMFSRLQVAATQGFGFEMTSKVSVKSRACNLGPAAWTATYQKAK